MTSRSKRNAVKKVKRGQKPVQKILFTMLEPIVAPAPKIAATLVRSFQDKAVHLRHTCIAQFLAKLLAILLKLALLLRVVGGWCRPALADSQRHISIVGRRRRRVDAALFISFLDIALWEDTLLSGTLVATTPPYM